MSRIKVAEMAGLVEGGCHASQHIELRTLVEHGFGAPGLHQEKQQVLFRRAGRQRRVCGKCGLHICIAAMRQAQHFGCGTRGIKAHGLQAHQRVLQVLRLAPAVPGVFQGDDAIGHHVVQELRGRHRQMLALQGHLTQRALASKNQRKEEQHHRHQAHSHVARLQHRLGFEPSHQQAVQRKRAPGHQRH